MIWIYAERVIALVKCLQITQITMHALASYAMRVHILFLYFELWVTTISATEP